MPRATSRPIVPRMKLPTVATSGSPVRAATWPLSAGCTPVAAPATSASTSAHTTRSRPRAGPRPPRRRRARCRSRRHPAGGHRPTAPGPEPGHVGRPWTTRWSRPTAMTLNSATPMSGTARPWAATKLRAEQAADEVPPLEVAEPHLLGKPAQQRRTRTAAERARSRHDHQPGAERDARRRAARRPPRWRARPVIRLWTATSTPTPNATRDGPRRRTRCVLGVRTSARPAALLLVRVVRPFSGRSGGCR